MEPGFRHEALIYGDVDEFLAAATSFLREGFEAGEPALVAVSPANAKLLASSLGADAADVRFADVETIGNPAQAMSFWRDFVDEHEGRRVRGISEPILPGRGPDEIEECRRQESLFNFAFGGSSEWSLLCAYDAGVLDEDVLTASGHSHATVERHGVREPSRSYEADVDCFAGGLSQRPPGTAGFEFDRADLAEVRRRVEESAEAAGLSGSRMTDLILAASELAANSVAHGGGGGTLRLWTEDSRLLVEFHDGGRIEDPLVGRVRPSITQEGGRGLWLANQLCDLVQIRSGEDGTTVRLHAVRG